MEQTPGPVRCEVIVMRSCTSGLECNLKNRNVKWLSSRENTLTDQAFNARMTIKTQFECQVEK